MNGRWSLRVLLVAGSLALVLSGCGEHRTSGIAPDVRTVENYPPQAPSVTESRAPAPLCGPRSQEEIDQIYARAGRSPQTTASLPRVEPMPNGLGIAVPAAWDVKITRDWRHIVIHHSASTVGSAAIFDKAHKERGWDGLGYHFVIGNGTASGDGEVEVGYRWTQQLVGAHAGNAEYNQHGIGICLVGDFENGRQPTPRQVASLTKLVRFLQVKTGIPTCEVIGHRDVPNKDTKCPGDFDVAAFRASLGTGSIGVPIYHEPQTVAARPAAASRTAITRSAGHASSALLP